MILAILLFSCNNKNAKQETITEILDQSIETKKDEEVGIDFPEMDYFVTDNLRLRENADLNSFVITILPQYTNIGIVETGHIETIDSMTGPWVRILSETGFTGWCFSGYIEQRANVDFIKVSNCIITKDYFVPNINNRIVGGEFNIPNELIQENDFQYISTGILIILKADTPIDRSFEVILKNQNYEFKKKSN